MILFKISGFETCCHCIGESGISLSSGNTEMRCTKPSQRINVNENQEC